MALGLIKTTAHGMQSDIARITRKWNRDIGCFEQQSLLTVKGSVRATRYISFHYKLIMRILTTNSFLHMIHIRENDLCTFCGVNQESLLHLFLQCQHVQAFWLEISQYLSRNGVGQLNDKVKIYGDDTSLLKTHIVTLAKYVIYDARYKEVRPSFHQFRLSLKRDFESENFIAAKQNDFESFNKKWNLVLVDLNDRSFQGRVLASNPGGRAP